MSMKRLSRDEAFLLAVDIAKLPSVPRQILKDIPRPPNTASRDDWANYAAGTAAGGQANGTTSAALIDTTLFDGNGTALSAVSGARLLSDDNNRIVGSAGSRFTGSAPLQ
jgi:hypothetical protein